MHPAILAMSNSVPARVVFFVALFLLCLLVFRKLDAAPKPMSRFMFGLIWVFQASIGFVPTVIWQLLASKGVASANYAYLGVSVVYAALLAFAARRRSVAAYGNDRNAWLVLIPIACLWLMFATPIDQYRVKRSGGQRAVRILLFVLGVIIVSIPQFVAKNAYENLSKTVIPRTADFDPATAAKIQAQIVNAVTPMQLDDVTVMTGAVSDGNALMFSYEIDLSRVASMTANDLRWRLADFVPKNFCSDINLNSLIQKGGEIRATYVVKQGSSSQPIQITVQSCQ